MFVSVCSEVPAPEPRPAPKVSCGVWKAGEDHMVPPPSGCLPLSETSSVRYQDPISCCREQSILFFCSSSTDEAFRSPQHHLKSQLNSHKGSFLQPIPFLSHLFILTFLPTHLSRYKRLLQPRPASIAIQSRDGAHVLRVRHLRQGLQRRR
jgi:hypothetical protein